jgi:hypothetical protein
MWNERNKEGEIRICFFFRVLTERSGTKEEGEEE